MRVVDWSAENFQAAISTGAAVAVPALAAARLRRVPSYYIESVSRVVGPSTTGKLLAVDRGIHLSCQYDTWADSRWKYRGTLFDRYRPATKPLVNSPSLFVTLGTISPYRFDELIDAVLRSGLADERTVWQTGSTARSGLPGKTYDQVPDDQFDELVRSADVVITHAGVGTIMRLLDMNRSPIIVPRRFIRHEHVDDHQTQIADALRGLGIGTVTEVEGLDRQLIIQSTAATVNGPVSPNQEQPR